jgi:glycosyltransferase involved in cell wall biosynthesis
MFNHFQVAANNIGVKHNMMCRLAPHIGDSLVSRARNTALRDFMDSECDYLFTLDDDIQLPPNALVDLVEADKDLIGGIYRLKNENPKRNPYAIRFLNENIRFDSKTVAKVQYLSTGCMLHKRSLIEELYDEYRDLIYYENMTGRKITALYMPYIFQNEYLSEDWAFCQRALDKGHEAWLHGGVQCGHWGLKNFAMTDLTTEQAKVT